MVGRCDPTTEQARYEAYVQRVVDEAPPLSDEQRAELRELFRVARASREMARPA